MAIKRVTTKITYRVPAWEFCNGQGNAFGRPSTDVCRFCVKEKGHYRCALYNEVLGTEQGNLIKKARACYKATAGFDSVVVDEEPEVADEATDDIPKVDPKVIVKGTLKLYQKTYHALINQGYPASIAEQVAYEYVLTGGNNG